MNKTDEFIKVSFLFLFSFGNDKEGSFRVRVTSS